MSRGALIWLIIFGISAACFFLIAAVVGYKGFADLQVLLRHSGTVKSKVQSPKSKVQGPGSKVQGPKSKVRSPKTVTKH